MRLKLFFASVLLTLGSIMTAQAQDVMEPVEFKQFEPPKEPISPADKWTGFYLGGQLTAHWVNVFRSSSWGDVSNAMIFTGIGSYLGYNIESKLGFVYGIETDLTRGFSGLRFTDIYPNVTINGSIYNSWHGATRLRLGFASRGFLPYIAGGVSYGDVDIFVDNADQSNVYGYTLGGGFDYAYTKRVILRLEGRYAQNYGLFSNLVIQQGVSQRVMRKSLSSKDLRFGIAYKF